MKDYKTTLATAITAEKYNMRPIYRDHAGFNVGGRHYDTIEQARGAINRSWKALSKSIKKSKRHENEKANSPARTGDTGSGINARV